MWEIAKIIIDGESINKNIKLKDDSNLTPEEREAVKWLYLKNKVSLFNSTKNELKSFIENDYWIKSEELVWKEGINIANNYFWIEWIDWKFSSKLFRKIITFQEKNWLVVDWVLWNNTLKILKYKDNFNVKPGLENINDISENIFIGILNEFISKLNSQEGVDLSTPGILDMIEKITGWLSSNSILTEKDKQNLIKNFLKPKEKGIKHIKFILKNTILSEKKDIIKEKKDFNDFKNILIDLIDKNWTLSIKDIDKIKNDQKFSNFFKENPQILIDISVYPNIFKDKWSNFVSKYLNEVKNNYDNFDEKENQSEDYNNYFSIFKSWLLFLYDSVNDKSPEEINVLIEEFKNIPAVKKLFDNIPNLKNLISDIIPWIIKSTDRSEFEKSINELYKNIKWDFINIVRFVDNKEVYWVKKSKLNMINFFTGFLQSNININSLDIINKSLIKLDIVKNNPLLSDIIELINWKDILAEDRLKILNEVLKIIKLSTSNIEISDFIVNKIIKENLSSIFNILSEKNPTKFKELFKTIFWNETYKNNENFFDSYYIFKLIWKNPWITKDIILKRRWNIEDTLIEIFKDKKLLKNGAKQIWWKISTIIRNVVNYDIKKVANKVKNEYLNETYNYLKEWNNENSKLSSNNEQISKWDIFDILIDELWKEGLLLIKNKIQNWDKINSVEIIENTIDALNKFIENNSDSIYEYLNWLWIKIDTQNDKKNAINIIKNIINNSWFKSMVLDFISDLWKKVKGENVWMKLKKIINEAIILNWKNILNNKVQWQAISIWIDAIFDDILKDENKLNTVIKLLRDNIWDSMNLNNNEAKAFLLTLKNHIWKDDIKNLIKKYPKLVSSNLLSEKYLEIIMNLYKWVENKNKLVNSLLNKGLINKISSSKEWNNEKFKDLDDGDINLITEWIYSTLEWNNSKTIWKTIANIFDKFWLSDLNNIKLFDIKLWKNIAVILSSLSKNDFKNILTNNKNNLNKLILWSLDDKQETLIYSNIWADIYSKLDIKKVQKQLDSQNLNDSEKLSLWLMDEFQEILNNDRDKINDLTEKWYDLYEMYKSGVEINEYAKNMKDQAENAFDILNSITQKISSKYLEQNLNLDSNTEKETKNKVFDDFIDSFIWNNKLFLIWQWWDRLFWDGNNHKSIYEYFNNLENRDNFWDTMKDFFVNTNEIKVAGRSENNNWFFEI